jgi:hypothetical protein
MILEAGKIAWTLLFGTVWERGWTLCVEGAFGIETLLKILVSNVVHTAVPPARLGRRETGYLSPDGWSQGVACHLFRVEDEMRL